MDILTDDYKKVNLYFKNILKNKKYDKIILFDFDNQHGQMMYNLIKNPASVDLQKRDFLLL